MSMGNVFRSRRTNNTSEPATPPPLTPPQATTSRNTSSNFSWGYSGSAHLLRNFLGSRLFSMTTTEQFIETVNRQIKPNDIRNLRDLFELVEFTLAQTTDALHFFTAIHCGYNEVFEHELARSKHLFGENSEIPLGLFMEKHCRNSLVIHCFIAENMENLHLVDEILNAIAASHAFLSKLSLDIKKHNETLFKFLKIEFSPYRSKETFVSLRKYFKIISARTQCLIEKKAEQKSMTEMREGMQFLRDIHQNFQVCTTRGSVKEIYRSDSETSHPQSVMIPFRSRTVSLPSYDSNGSAISLI